MENQLTKTENKSIETLFDKVEIVHKVINQATIWNVEAENLQIKSNKERKEAKSIKKTIWFSPLIGLLCLLINPVFALIIPIALVIHLLLPKNRLKAHIKKAEEYEKKSQEKFNSANMLVKEYAKELRIIPQKYWYPMATEFLVEVVQTGRATTLPVALDKLEEQIHRWNMEAAMQQALNLQIAQTEALRRIEINTTASVIADVADLFI